VYRSPEAAHIVFECGVRLTVVPLEVTHTALVTPEVRASLLGDGSRFRRLVDELMQFFAQTYKDVFAFEHPPLHDPCAVAYVLRPDLFTVRRHLGRHLRRHLSIYASVIG
jgi:purine nucleosidase